MQDQTMVPLGWARREAPVALREEELQWPGLVRPPPPPTHSSAMEEAEEHDTGVVVEVEWGMEPSPWEAEDAQLEGQNVALLKERVAARRTPPADWPSSPSGG